MTEDELAVQAVEDQQKTKPQKVIGRSTEELRKLRAEGKLDWPSVTEEEWTRLVVVYEGSKWTVPEIVQYEKRLVGLLPKDTLEEKCKKYEEPPPLTENERAWYWTQCEELARARETASRKTAPRK